MEPRVGAYLGALHERLVEVFGSRLAGVYAIGSLALGGFVLGRSDIDVIAVVTEVRNEDEKRAVVEALSHPNLECPSRGLEFVLYEERAVRIATEEAAFALNLNTGPGMSFSCSFDPASEPAHWFVLDRAIARAGGLVLHGPSPRDLLASIPRPWLLRALQDSLEWHVAHEGSGPNVVLNAARAWRFALEDVWSSKTAAAEWAKKRGAPGSLIDTAVARREGLTAAELDRDAVDAFIARVVEDLRVAPEA